MILFFLFLAYYMQTKKKRGDLTLMEKLYIAFPSANKNTVLNIVVFMPHDKENLRGMIQICHGMTEHIDRYDDFAEYFTERGYAVFGNDIISTVEVT